MHSEVQQKIEHFNDSPIEDDDDIKTQSGAFTAGDGEAVALGTLNMT